MHEASTKVPSYIILKLSGWDVPDAESLNTILIYIILKLMSKFPRRIEGLSTILIYIILKPQIQEDKPHRA